MARRATAADGAIQTHLEDEGLPITFFNRPIVSYTRDNLRTFIQFVAPAGRALRGWRKRQLCLRLVRLNGGRIAATERAFLTSFGEHATVDSREIRNVPSHVLEQARRQDAGQREFGAQRQREHMMFEPSVNSEDSDDSDFQVPTRRELMVTADEAGDLSDLFFDDDFAIGSSLAAAHPVAVVIPGPRVNDTPCGAGERTNDCQSCLERLPMTEFPAPPDDAECTHREGSFCTICFEQHIIASVDNSPLDQIPCPEPGCTASLSYEQMRLRAPLRIFHRYSVYINETALVRMPGYLECSSATCENAFIVGPAEQPRPHIRCSLCRQRTCVTCRTPWHPGLSHQENMENLQRQEEQRAAARRADQDVQSEELVQRISKICPNEVCGARIQRNGGCDHMTCQRCTHQFCWRCLSPWRRPHRCVVPRSQAEDDFDEYEHDIFPPDHYVLLDDHDEPDDQHEPGIFF